MNPNLTLSKSIIKLHEKMIYCSVCLDEIPFSKSIMLSCAHRFCLECVTREWEYNIMNGYFSTERLKCPHDGCKVPITYYELKTLLKPEVFKRYEDNSIKNFQTSRENPEVAVICPNSTCQTKSMVPRNYSWFQCKYCNLKFCVDCLGDWSKHDGKTCKEFKENNLSADEKAFREEIKKKKWMPCPECKNVVEKIEFCNFIRCSSPQCQQKTCFCYLCGMKLTQAEHFDHYIDKNPYGNQCNGIGGQKGEKSIGLGKCPKCGTNDSNLVEFQSNFNNKIVFCKSDFCKDQKGQGQHVCLKCRNYLDEKLMNLHLDKPDFDCEKINLFEKKCVIF